MAKGLFMSAIAQTVVRKSLIMFLAEIRKRREKVAKLDLIVPHYKEDIALMQPMLDILKLQRNVKWSDFRV